MIHTKIIYSYIYGVIPHQRAFSNISVWSLYQSGYRWEKYKSSDTKQNEVSFQCWHQTELDPDLQQHQHYSPFLSISLCVSLILTTADGLPPQGQLAIPSFLSSSRNTEQSRFPYWLHYREPQTRDLIGPAWVMCQFWINDSGSLTSLGYMLIPVWKREGVCTKEEEMCCVAKIRLPESWNCTINYAIDILWFITGPIAPHHHWAKPLDSESIVHEVENNCPQKQNSGFFAYFSLSNHSL